MLIITIILAAVIGISAFDITSKLKEPPEQMSFEKAEVLLGAEYRDYWAGSGSNETHGDIDLIYLDYLHGQKVKGDEIGSIIIRWKNSSGEGGELRFVNPAYFNEETQQKYHNEDVGTFCTGDLSAGDRLAIRMVHNRYQYTGETPRDEIGVQYVESNSNQVDVVGKYPFFRTEGRYPVDFEGDRPMEAKDQVEITFLGPDHYFVISKITATAKEYTENAKGDSKLECPS
ncbi:type IV pilin [Methanohalophilus halophilus]|nr:type IV pilin [Methanohalophilus halophilus]